MKILVILAHADDETLGCGGTLARYPNSTVITLSDCIVRARGKVQDNRESLNKACNNLMAESYIVGLPDQMFESRNLSNAINKVSEIIDVNVIEFDTVITHSPNDINRDHRITFEIAEVIARPKDKPVSLICCEIPSDASWGNKFHPGMFISLNEMQYEMKRDAMYCYENELMEYPHPNSIACFRTLMAYRGIQCGAPMAEAFEIIRWCM